MLLPCFLLFPLLTWPLKLAGQDEPRAGDPFVETFIECIPMDEELVLVEFGVGREEVRWGCVGGRGCGGRGCLTAEIRIVGFVAYGQNFCQSLLER